jgi:gas vesicle structural protein
MTVATSERRTSNRYIASPSPSGLADVIDLILDKGLVIDVYVRVSLVGIELLTIDARIVIAGVDTYLRFAEAVQRLDLTQTETSGIPELLGDITEGGAEKKTKGALSGAKEKVTELIGGGEDNDDEGDGDDDGDDEDERRRRARARRRREARKAEAGS